MKRTVLDYYQRELNYLKRRGDAFADSYPKIAARLQLNDEVSRDPHVERLIQGVAFLNAKIRKNIEDDFPQLCQSLLDVIYPHYLRPLPSYSIVSFVPEDDMTDPTLIPANTTLESGSVDEYSCRFRTAYDTNVVPLQVAEATLRTYPAVAPKTADTGEISAVLKIVLEPANTDVEIEELELDKIRFYIKGSRYYSHSLYELMHNHLIRVAVAKRYDDPDVVFIDNKKAVSPVGFDKDEGLLPYPQQSFIGYRLLTEFFAYPEKFLFFDLSAPLSKVAEESDKVELYFYFDKNLPDIEATVDASNFVLNATPIINLFEQISEPVKLDNLHYEYPMLPDVRHPEKVEVYTVNDVAISDGQDNVVDVRPFFGVSHTYLTDGDRATYWHARREEHEIGERRAETNISLINLDMTPRIQSDWVMVTRVTCFNSNLPRRLSQLSAEPELTLTEGAAVVKKVELKMPFSEVSRPRLDDNVYWKLLSHLNLNYLSLSDKEEGTEALREILNLYNYRGTSENNNLIEAVTIRKVVPTTARVVGDNGVPYFCRGNKIIISLDPDNFAGSSPYLFACVLERFLALYTNINSFVQLEVQLGDSDQVLKRWTPRAGEQCLI
ncbi:MAG: type VI secretion system baseplate subunit TssF [Chromatiales bacterium]|nr:type VI secretion system baseplate subunit TssF [Chromatiales bacterium]